MSATLFSRVTRITLTNFSPRPLQLEGDGEGEGGGSKALFLEKVRQSNAACQSGDFETAVALYTEAIALDPHNHILYSNRSAAHIKLAKFAHALQDATKARELNPKWPKVSCGCIPSGSLPLPKVFPLYMSCVCMCVRLVLFALC